VRDVLTTWLRCVTLKRMTMTAEKFRALAAARKVPGANMRD
jgi:hypothetical protein